MGPTGPTRATPPTPADISTAASRPDAGPRHPADVVRARDAAVLAFVQQHSPVTEDRLVAALPPEPGQTAEQRRQALERSLARLKLRDRAVRQTCGGAWEPMPSGEPVPMTGGRAC